MRLREFTEFHGETGLVEHTGAQNFCKDSVWRASDREEGLWLGDGGELLAVMPGQSIRLGRLGRGDLFVFRRDGEIHGLVGDGGVADAAGALWGGYGTFRAKFLLPRRALTEARRALEGETSLARAVAGILRPDLLAAMERAVGGRTRRESTALLREVEAHAAKAMGARLPAVGLALEEFKLERFQQTEGFHGQPH